MSVFVCIAARGIRVCHALCEHHSASMDREQQGGHAAQSQQARCYPHAASMTCTTALLHPPSTLHTHELQQRPPDCTCTCTTPPAGLTQADMSEGGGQDKQELPGGPAAYPVHDDPSVSSLTSEGKPVLQSDKGDDMADEASRAALSKRGAAQAAGADNQ